jgi:D-3-phosphoglycerate dehydrogenase
MPTFRVIVAEPINMKGVEYLREKGVEVVELPPGSSEADLMEIVDGADGIISRGSIRITREILEKGSRLRVVGVHGQGCDHVDLKAAGELGKVVCNTPDALTVTVAEMTLGLILAAFRNLVAADKAVRAGQWNRKYGDLIGLELAGKTVGVVGLGRIGLAVARLLRAFDADVIYWSRTRKPEAERDMGIRWVELDELLRSSDLVSLHVPGTAETRQLIGDRELGLMKRGVILVNMARGTVVDEAALIRALGSGKIRVAALDVFEKEPIGPNNPLMRMDNVILTPHLGACNLEGMQRMAVQVAEGIYKVLTGQTPDNPVVI